MNNEKTLIIPPPWRLTGHALIQLQRIPLRRAREWVPPRLKLVPVLPGRTLGGIYYASYGAGSTRQYHELIVVPAMVRYGHRIGAWISHIYVDDSQSLAAGREYWGLHKQRAQFQETANGTVAVTQDDLLLCTLDTTLAPGRIPMPLFAPVITMKEDRVLWFQGTGSADMATGNGSVAVGPYSPFAGLGIHWGRRIYLASLNIRLHGPKAS